MTAQAMGFFGTFMFGWGFGGTVLKMNPQPSDPYVMCVGLAVAVVGGILLLRGKR